MLQILRRASFLRMTGTGELFAVTLGDKIRFARENAGLTQEELGKRCGTTKQTIYKYETGKITNIPLDRLESIANIVGVSSLELLGWSEQSNEKPTVLTDDGLTESQKALIKLAQNLTEQEAEQILQTVKLILQGLRK